MARHLTLLAERRGDGARERNPPSLDIDLVACIAARELARLHDIYEAANAGDDDATRQYLAGYGWRVEGRQMRQTRDHAVFDRLGATCIATARRPSLMRTRRTCDATWTCSDG